MKKNIHTSSCTYALNCKIARIGFSFLAILLFGTIIRAQDYIINRGTLSSAYIQALSVVDKNEYYGACKNSGTSKATVVKYKNGTSSDISSASLPVCGNGLGMARDSANNIIYLSFSNATNDTIYTYKRGAADADWVYITKLPRPNVSYVINAVSIVFNKNAAKVFISFSDASPTTKIYLYRLDAGAWTNFTGASSMSCNNWKTRFSTSGNKVVITASYNNLLNVYSFDVVAETLTSLPAYTTNNSNAFSTTVYNPDLNEYVAAYTSSGVLGPKAIKYSAGSWTDISTGLPADNVSNGSFGIYAGYNNITKKYSIFYSNSGTSSLKGYYWDGSAWTAITVPYVASINVVGMIDYYKDIYFNVNNGASNQIVLYSAYETPLRNTLNITALSASTSCAISFPERGDGHKVAVFVKMAASYDAPVPVNNTTYTANTVFGSGTQLTSTGWYCVYNNVGESFTITGLTNNTTYQLQAFEYNGNAGTEMYIDGAAVSGNPISFTTSCINPASAGTVTANQSGYAPFDPAAFTSTAAAAGYSGGTLEYKWQQSTTSSVAGFSDIASSNTAAYDPAAITVTTWYKRLARVNCKADWTGAVESNVVQVTVSPTWMGTTSSDWNTASNWNPAVVPSSGNMYVSPSALNPLVLNTDYTMGAIVFAGGSPKIIVGNYSLTASSVSGANSTSYVQTTGAGVFKMSVIKNASVIFPVGNGAYNPVSITNNSDADDDFTVKVLDEVFVDGAEGATVPDARVMRTWNISKTNANSGAGINFIFNWNSGEEAGSMAEPALYHLSGSWAKQTAGVTGFTPGNTFLSYTGYTGTFSPFAIVDGSSTLAAGLMNFKAQKSGDKVKLTWSTASEQNSKDFIVQQSVNGIVWNNIGTVQATGNSNVPKFYSFTDNNPAMGNNYYRLLQRSTDGKNSFSNVLNIVFNGSADIFRIIGNPVTNGQLQLQLSSAAVVTLYNDHGQQLQQFNLEAGSQLLDVSRYANGLYLIKSGKQILKLMIQY